MECNKMNLPKRIKREMVRVFNDIVRSDFSGLFREFGIRHSFNERFYMKYNTLYNDEEKFISATLNHKKEIIKFFHDRGLFYITLSMLVYSESSESESIEKLFNEFKEKFYPDFESIDFY